MCEKVDKTCFALGMLRSRKQCLQQRENQTWYRLKCWFKEVNASTEKIHKSTDFLVECFFSQRIKTKIFLSCNMLPWM